MAQAAAEAMYEHQHKDLPFHDGTFTHWAKEWSPDTPNHFKDGVTIWVSEEPPEESTPL